MLERILVAQLLQKYQMMNDGPAHRGVLAIGYTKLRGGLLHDAGERRVVGMADEGTEVVRDVVVEAAGEPTDDGIVGRVVGGGGEDVIDAVVKLAALGGEIGAVDGVGGLEDQRDAEADDEMDQKEGSEDQQRDLCRSTTGRTSM